MQSAGMRRALAAWGLALMAVSGAGLSTASSGTGSSAGDVLPDLAWEVRSDWLSATEGCSGGPKAKGDGHTDDTEALAACFRAISNETGNTTVHIGPGSFRITESLLLFKVLGGLVVGHGERTRLVWDGPPGGKMVVSDGCSRTRFVGLVFDGQHRAAVGLEHDAHRPGLFETRIRHQMNKFVGFQTAGIRIGYNHTGGKLETSEVIYSDCIFRDCGTAGVEPSGGILILNFNDYDNVFMSSHWSNCTTGIYAALMANVYVRDCRFEGSSEQDILLAPSAGNSIRRTVSVGSRAFVASEHHTASNPTTIEGCVVDGWTSPHGAIGYNLRGPLLLLDNAFTNGTSNVTRPPVQTTPWPQTTQAILLSGNTMDAAPANASQLVLVAANNTVVTDLPAPTGPRETPLTAATRFLAASWPMPTAIIDARAMGAAGDGHTDDTAAVQATITSAAHKGNGALAYFPKGTYSVNKTIVVPIRGNFTVSGSGFRSVISWDSKSAAPESAVLVIGSAHSSAASPNATAVAEPELGPAAEAGHPTLSQLMVQSTFASTPKVLHSGPGSAFYDGVYTTTFPGKSQFNTTGFEVRKLARGDVVQARHIDGNLLVSDSHEGTVLAGFLVQGTLRVTGPQKAAGSRFRGDSGNTKLASGVFAATMVGLLDDFAVVVEDSASVVVADLYSEQLPTGNLLLSGTTGAPLPDGAVVGRVTVSAVKASATEGRLITANNYAGSITLLTAFNIGGNKAPLTIAQTGSAPCNITLLASALWGQTAKEALTWSVTHTAKTSAVGNIVAYYGSAPMPTGQTILYPELAWSGTDAAVAAALDDLRTLSLLDLQLNHPELFPRVFARE